MIRARIAAAALAMVFCLALALAGVAAPGLAAELPAQLLQFLPERADGLVVVPSLEELDLAWSQVRSLTADLMDEGDEPLPLLDDLLATIPEPYGEALDHTRPLAAAFTVPNPMSGQEMGYWLVLPVLPSDADFMGLAQIMGLPTALQKKGYLLLSSEEGFTGSAGPARLGGMLPEGVVRLSLDLQSLWAQFGPLMDFALAAASAPPPAAADSTGAAPQPALTPEQTQATGQMVRDFFTSADVLAMAFDLRDDELLLIEEFSVLAGSPLDPPSQPDFDRALELTRLLPRDADLVTAYAMDLPGVMNMYKEYYTLSMAPLFESMGQAAGTPGEELLAPIMAAFDVALEPTALALGRQDDRLLVQYVTRSDRVQDILALQKQSMDLMSRSASFVQVSEVQGLKTEGTQVLGWDFAWDPAAFAAMAQAQGPASAGDDENLAAIGAAFEKVMPGLRMATRDDLLFVSLGRDLDPLTAMIKESKQRRGAPHPQLAKLAKTAGPDCQALVYGDLAAMMGLVLEIVEEVSGEEVPALDLSPLPITEAVRVGHGKYGVDYRIGLKGLVEFVQAVEALDEEN